MACFPLTINLCQSLPLPRTPRAATHTLRCAQTNACVHAYAPRSRRHCGGSLIMQLILSDSDMYNGRFPGGSMCQSTHPSYTPLLLLFIILPTYHRPHPNIVLLSTLSSSVSHPPCSLYWTVSFSVLRLFWRILPRLLHSCPPVFPHKPAK